MRAALTLASSSCASAFSSLLRVLGFECGSYGIVDRVARTEEHMWGSQENHWGSCHHLIQNLGLQSHPSDSPRVLTVLDLSIRQNFRASSRGAGTGPGNGS